MAIANGYLTLAELKSWLKIDTDDTTDDTLLEAVIEAVSRQIDEFCKRRFYTTGADETRYFTAVEDGRVEVGDLLSVTRLQTDGDGSREYADMWAATDYDLCPYNRALEGKPYAYIEATPCGDYSFPTVPKGVQVVGRWGWGTAGVPVPSVVKLACLIQSDRTFKRRVATFGVAGSAEMGQVMVLARLDPDVRGFLEPLRLTSVG